MSEPIPPGDSPTADAAEAFLKQTRTEAGSLPYEVRKREGENLFKLASEVGVLALNLFQDRLNNDKEFISPEVEDILENNQIHVLFAGYDENHNPQLMVDDKQGIAGIGFYKWIRLHYIPTNIENGLALYLGVLIDDELLRELDEKRSPDTELEEDNYDYITSYKFRSDGSIDKTVSIPEYDIPQPGARRVVETEEKETPIALVREYELIGDILSRMRDELKRVQPIPA